MSDVITDEKGAEEECPVCLEMSGENRYLACGHLFCTDCLRHLEDQDNIRCPVCRLYTYVGKASAGGLSTPERPRECGVQVDRRIALEGSVTCASIDERRRRILIVSDSADEPVKIFTYGGEQTGCVSHSDLAGQCIGVAVDTRRDRILLLTESSLYAFSADGRWLRTLSDMHSQFNDVGYDHVNDRYVLADCTNKRPVAINPSLTTVSTCSGPEHGMILSLCVATGGDAPKCSPHYIINDCHNRKLRYMNESMEVTRDIDVGPETLGHLGYVCGISMDREGRVLACDSGNRTVLRTNADGQWETLLDQGDFGFERPHEVVASTTGPTVVTSYIDRGEGRLRKSTVYLLNTN